MATWCSLIKAVSGFEKAGYGSIQCNAFEGYRPSEGQLCLFPPLPQHTGTRMEYIFLMNEDNSQT